MDQTPLVVEVLRTRLAMVDVTTLRDIVVQIVTLALIHSLDGVIGLIMEHVLLVVP